MKPLLLPIASALLALGWAPVPSRAQSGTTSAPAAATALQALTHALAGKWKLDVRFEADSSVGEKVIEGTGEESWSAGPGGIALIEQEHIPSPQGNTFLMGIVWWDSAKNQLGGVECNNYLPVTCDLKGGLTDVTVSWDGKKFQIDELETHNGRHTIWHEYWTNITSNSFTQTGDVTRPDGSTVHFMTIHATRVKELKTIGAE